MDRVQAGDFPVGSRVVLGAPYQTAAWVDGDKQYARVDQGIHGTVVEHRTLLTVSPGFLREADAGERVVPVVSFDDRHDPVPVVAWYLVAEEPANA